MCGRFSLSKRELVEITDFLDAEISGEDAARHRPRYNVAPTDECLIAVPGRVPDGKRSLMRAVWGFSGLEDKPVINARAETVTERRMFQDAFARRRCLVPADGFFEWTGAKGRRRPIWFHAADGRLLLFAGLWETRLDARPAFTIVTTEANATVAPVHDRMPVVLDRDQAKAWLAQPRLDLLRPAPVDLLAATPVSPKVNAVENDDPSCLEPAELPAEPQLKLF
jgi:putative SOS response-associated peptidase YedK